MSIVVGRLAEAGLGGLELHRPLHRGRPPADVVSPHVRAELSIEHLGERFVEGVRESVETVLLEDGMLPVRPHQVLDTREFDSRVRRRCAVPTTCNSRDPCRESGSPLWTTAPMPSGSST
ncbi:hypothetical protein NPS01_30540 [Nocardioides psychrotolerans]|nr:hypothetical protein NPS01_30540 [Nocardioides psychrotolerans]